MLKGTLEVALLALLGAGPSYGQGLFSALVDAGLPGVADASVYGALRRLESEGLLRSELVASEGGAARRYYRLTRAGRARRKDGLSAWSELSRAMTRVLRAAP